MPKKHVSLLLLLPMLIAACNPMPPPGTLPFGTATRAQEFEATQTTSPALTKTPTITSTPLDTLTPTITPTSVTRPPVHPLAVNEQNAQAKVKQLATFGELSNCPINPDLNNAVGMRLIDGKPQYLLAVGNAETGDIQIWDLEAKKILHTLKPEGIWFARSFAFHPDQQRLISITRDDSAESAILSLWDIQSGEILHKSKLGNRDGPIKISPDGLALALFTVYGEADVRVSELNLQTSEIRDAEYAFPLYWETKPPYAYTAKDDLLAITYASDEKLHLLDLSNHADTELQFPFASLDEADQAQAILSTMAINSGGSYIAGGAKNGYIYIWDATNGKLIQTMAAHKPSVADGWLGGIKILEFSPESNLLVSVGYDGFTKLWNAKTGTLLRKLNVCYFGGFTPDGLYLVTIGSGGIQLWGVP